MDELPGCDDASVGDADGATSPDASEISDASELPDASEVPDADASEVIDASDASEVTDAANADASDAEVIDADVSDAALDADAAPVDPLCPVPTIHEVSPNPIMPSDKIVDVFGCGFPPTARVFRDGLMPAVALPTTYISATHLRATFYLSSTNRQAVFFGVKDGPLTTSDFPTFRVSVMTIAQVRSVSPDAVVAGGASFTLSIQAGCGYDGGGFDVDAKFLLDDIELTSPVFSGAVDGHDRACVAELTVPASLIATPRDAVVTVVNPGVPASPPVVLHITP